MLKLMTPLEDIQRFDITALPGLLTSGYQGQWTVPGATYSAYPTSGIAGCFQIWTEGNRDGTAGFTPDTANTGKLTVLYGKYRARTDRFNGGTPVVGTRYTVNADGDLGPVLAVTVSGGAQGAGEDPSVTGDHVYAICIGTSTMTYFDHNSGSAFQYLEFVTV